MRLLDLRPHIKGWLAGQDETLDDEEFQLDDEELTPEGAKEAGEASKERGLGGMRWRGASRKALPALVPGSAEDAGAERVPLLT